MTLKWRRTSIDGRTTLDDDWSLSDGGLSLARLYRVKGGPQDGKWMWFVQVYPDGAPGNGGFGIADARADARRDCETQLPEAFRARVQREDEH